MKIMKEKYYRLCLSCLLLSGLALISCEEEGDTLCSGAPSITSVSTVDRSSSIPEGSYNQFVIITGQNFCEVQKLMFNDVEVAVDQLYATPTEITARIPNVAPDTKTNTITLETAGGQATYDFAVIIPAIAIHKVDNEYARVGTSMTLVGASFDYGGYTTGRGKIYVGDTEATVTYATSDTLVITVPEGATQGDIIRGVDKNGTEFSYQYPYKDNTNMVVNYDDKPTAVWSRKNYVGQDPLPGAIDGNYSHFVEQEVRSGWAQDQFFKGKVILPQDVVDNPGNYVIKFEVNTSKPLTTSGIRIFADLPSNKFYAWNPTSSVPFDTHGKWITHSISLQDANGKVTPLQPRANNEYELRGIVTTGVSFSIDISFDNWRIVAKPENK